MGFKVEIESIFIEKEDIEEAVRAKENKKQKEKKEEENEKTNN